MNDGNGPEENDVQPGPDDEDGPSEKAMGKGPVENDPQRAVDDEELELALEDPIDQDPITEDPQEAP